MTHEIQDENEVLFKTEQKGGGCNNSKEEGGIKNDEEIKISFAEKVALKERRRERQRDVKIRFIGGNKKQFSLCLRLKACSVSTSLKPLLLPLSLSLCFPSLYPSFLFLLSLSLFLTLSVLSQQIFSLIFWLEISWQLLLHGLVPIKIINVLLLANSC